MRGSDVRQGAMWSYLSPEARVPKDHPLRKILELTDRALAELAPLFDTMYSHIGRPSIPPERLVRALVLQHLYSIRSERLLMEQLDCDLRFRWFVGLNADDPVWDATVYSKHREDLVTTEVAQAFLAAVAAQAGEAGLLSDEHFTVDGTLLEAWASQKSFRPRAAATTEAASVPGAATSSAAPADAGGKGEGGASGGAPAGSPGDFKGQRRSNATHQSTTDPDARLYRKGPGHEARLAYLGHVLSENRSGLVVGGTVTLATGTAEREAALALTEQLPAGATLGCDKAYDTADFVEALRERGITPHVCRNTSGRRSRIDGRTTRHAGYAMSQTARRLREGTNGWLKCVGLQRKARARGRERVGWAFVFALGVYDLVRMRPLLAARAT